MPPHTHDNTCRRSYQDTHQKHRGKNPKFSLVGRICEDSQRVLSGSRTPSPTGVAGERKGFLGKGSGGNHRRETLRGERGDSAAGIRSYRPRNRQALSKQVSDACLGCNLARVHAQSMS